MDNIKFVGYSDAGTMKTALKHRSSPIELETFYKRVNQASNGCCSCCKKENVVIYAIQPVGLPIKANALSLCYECLRSLPKELTVINTDSNGAPPALIYKIYESKV